MVNYTSIEALIKLIDDPDDTIFLHVRDKLMQYGPDAIPYLESSWEGENYGLLFQTRIEEIIHDIQFHSVKDDLNVWINSDEKKLLEGSIIIAKFQFPELDFEEVKQDIANIRKDIWLELNPKQTVFEKIKTFNEVFFRIHGFKGNTKNFHAPLNSYINTVLESRKGNPLSLCIIYSILAQSLELPIYGVNLPNHFVLAFMDEDNNYLHINPESEKTGALFYINVFGKGSIFNHSEITQFLKKLKIEPKKEHYEPCSNTLIIKRMLANLIAGYQQQGNADKVEKLVQLRSLFK